MKLTLRAKGRNLILVLELYFKRKKQALGVCFVFIHSKMCLLKYANAFLPSLYLPSKLNLTLTRFQFIYFAFSAFWGYSDKTSLDARLPKGKESGKTGVRSVGGSDAEGSRLSRPFCLPRSSRLPFPPLLRPATQVKAKPTFAAEAS